MADQMQLARRVQRACLEAARAAFEDAGIQGLCCEGRLEAAIGAVERVDLTTLLDPAPPPRARPPAEG